MISGNDFGFFYLILNTFIADNSGIEAELPPAKKFSFTNQTLMEVARRMFSHSCSVASATKYNSLWWKKTR
jgi:hypothetical protein